MYCLLNNVDQCICLSNVCHFYLGLGSRRVFTVVLHLTFRVSCLYHPVLRPHIDESQSANCDTIINLKYTTQ